MESIQKDHDQFLSQPKIKYEDGFVILDKTVVLVRKGPNDVIPEKTWMNPILIENNKEQCQDQDQDQNGHIEQIINYKSSKEIQEKNCSDQHTSEKPNKESSHSQKDDEKNNELKDDHKSYNTQWKCQCHAVFTPESIFLPTDEAKSKQTKILQSNLESMANQNNFDGQIECQPFLGNISDQYITCSCKHCSKDFADESSKVKQNQRSDASLMLGLILWNATHELVDLRSIQLFLHQPVESSISTSLSSLSAEIMPGSGKSLECSDPSQNVENEICTDQSFILFEASLAITLSLSFVSFGNNTPKYHYKGEVLPMSTQLLLSILQSDWKRFELYKMELQQFDHLETSDQFQSIDKKPSFFPTELSLQQVRPFVLYCYFQIKLKHSSYSFYFHDYSEFVQLVILSNRVII